MTTRLTKPPVDLRADRLETGARCLAAGTAILAVLVLLGWIVGSASLTSVAPRMVAMNPLTAVGFLLAGASLGLATMRDSLSHRRLAIVCAAAVILVAGSRLFGYAGFDLGLDRAIFTDRLDAEAIPNRMAPNTAAAFLLAGCGLLGLHAANRRLHVATQLLGVVVLAIAMVTLCGYTYHASGLARVGDFIPMALNTAVGFAALAVGILCARPRTGLLADLIGEGMGSRMARHMLPAIVGIPLFLGWLRVSGEQAGLYDSSTGTGLLVASWVLVLGATVWWQTQILNRADLKRTAAESEIAALNRKLRRRATEIETANRELEAFSYSVSHDLRAPLRSITSFSQALLEDCSDTLDEQGRDYLERVVRAGKRMADLIEDMLVLSRISRADMGREHVDLSATAEDILSELAQGEPERKVAISIQSGLVAEGDPKLLRIMLGNLIGNAWKFTSFETSPLIEFGIQPSKNGERVFYVRDNGAGFDMAHAELLFTPFQRLHREAEFPGTGVGLATVQRVVRRHGGKVWAQSEVSRGATFFFTV
jgi:signal transduction histidine kinase